MVCHLLCRSQSENSKSQPFVVPVGAAGLGVSWSLAGSAGHALSFGNPPVAWVC